jgi:hypothetical protein
LALCVRRWRHSKGGTHSVHPGRATSYEYGTLCTRGHSRCGGDDMVLLHATDASKKQHRQQQLLRAAIVEH